MRALALFAVAFFSYVISSVADAQTLTPEQVDQLKRDVQRRLEMACGVSSETLRYRDVNAEHVEVYTSQWTGACTNGVSDGFGRSTIQVRFAIATSGMTDRFIITNVLEGTVVHGQRVGLWCTLSSRSGTEEHQQRPACAVGGVGAFSKRADGSWSRATRYGVFTEPPEVYPAGALEAESERIIADARRGIESAPVNLLGQASALSDLVAGASIRLSPDPSVTDVRGKRIAIVLSSRAVSELQRWSAQRQIVMDRLQPFRRNPTFEEYFANFVRRTDPSRLVMGATATILSAGGVPLAADDLSVLQDGRADYALVMDWHYDANIPTSLREWRAFPVCAWDATCENAIIYSAGFATYLVTPDMRAIAIGGWPQGTIRRSDANQNTMVSLAIVLSNSEISASAGGYLPGATFRPVD